MNPPLCVIPIRRPASICVTQIPPLPDPDIDDLPGQDDPLEEPPEPLRDPERVPPLPVNADARARTARRARAPASRRGARDA
ncbi:hypothetical protein [Burkholderia gladioli]|uniref:hypothetical protein n=1 Tax=Burkholderia gladioli TaxID=28095 RepID=UPI001640306A|nr:hypothetical protein [Burkholderia gladioli]